MREKQNVKIWIRDHSRPPFGAVRRAVQAAVTVTVAAGSMLALPVAPAAASGLTLSVKVTGTDAGNCQASACATIGYALSQGTSGDTISVGPGTFVEQTLVLSYPVTIDGAGAGATTVNVSQHNPICATYIAVSISITSTNNPCTYPGPTAGVYTFNNMTIEGNPGGIASAAVEPYLVFAQGLPPNTSLVFTNDTLVTNTTVDPNLASDASIGVYDLGSGPTDTITVSHDTIRGFFQGTFMESFPGSLIATDSTYTGLVPNTGPFAPEGIFLLADAAGPMNGNYTISGNTFENYAGYGVRAKSGFFNPNQNGDLENVAIVGNKFTLTPLPGALNNGSAAIGINGADSGGNTVKNISIASNSISDVGLSAADVQMTGAAGGNTFSGVSVIGNDLLGGPNTAGIDNETASLVTGSQNFWGVSGGPSAPGATKVVTGNGGSVSTGSPALQSVFSPSGVTASDTSNGSIVQVLISWIAPASAHDVPVLTYSITPHDLTTGTAGSPITVPGTATSATVSGLVPGDRYTFSVQANNALVIAAPGISNSTPGPDGKGYWLDATDGGIFSFGSAKFYGSTGSIRLNQPIVGMAATPTGKGYWLVAADGGVFAFGDAQFFGSMGSIHLNQPVVGIATTATGKGYWLVAKDGGVFSFGDATFHGSTGGIHLNKPIVGIASTPDGKGYWFVGTDGGVFTFGDAKFFGSTGGSRINSPVIGIAASPSGMGYWLVGTDGGVFAFGDATFFGSMGGIPLNQPVVGIAANPSGTGYWLDASDGGVFAFGGAQFFGSMGGIHLNRPVVGMAGH